MHFHKFIYGASVQELHPHLTSRSLVSLERKVVATRGQDWHVQLTQNKSDQSLFQISTGFRSRDIDRKLFPIKADGSGRKLKFY